MKQLAWRSTAKFSTSAVAQLYLKPLCSINSRHNHSCHVWSIEWVETAKLSASNRYTRKPFSLWRSPFPLIIIKRAQVSILCAWEVWNLPWVSEEAQGGLLPSLVTLTLSPLLLDQPQLSLATSRPLSMVFSQWGCMPFPRDHYSCIVHAPNHGSYQTDFTEGTGGMEGMNI